ncbi:MAG: CoA transferase [Deltaproteobacteria bacterium]|nr:CoA transferase [Deltaproteobacteria bacterium]
MTDFSRWANEATDPGKAADKPEALSGMRVLEYCPGHFGGMVASSVLGEFGADVIKLEPPAGDPARGYAPEGISIGETGLLFLSEARNRRFATLSLESEEGREIFRRLAKGADVIVTTEYARMCEKGIGYASLSSDNPGLIFLSLSLYGSFGPDANRKVKDSDILCQALSGAPHIVGEPEIDGTGPPEPHQAPTRLGNWHGWFVQGLWGAFGVMAALNFRAGTGKGQFVDVSGAEALMKFTDYNITWMHTAGQARQRVGNFDPAVFPYTYIRCKDGHTFMAAYNDEAFDSLMNIVGRPELAKDPRFASPSARVRMENEKALLSILEEWSENLTADEILRAVEDYTSKKSGPGAAVVTGRVNRPLETLSESNWWERGCFARVDDPVYGDLLLAAPPWKMSGTPARIKSVCRPAGSDNREIYCGLLGFSRDEVDGLSGRGII